MAVGFQSPIRMDARELTNERAMERFGDRLATGDCRPARSACRPSRAGSIGIVDRDAAPAGSVAVESQKQVRVRSVRDARSIRVALELTGRPLGEEDPVTSADEGPFKLFGHAPGGLYLGQPTAARATPSFRRVPWVDADRLRARRRRQGGQESDDGNERHPDLFSVTFGTRRTPNPAIPIRERLRFQGR